MLSFLDLTIMTRGGTKMRLQENGITNSTGSKMKPVGNGIMRTGKNDHKAYPLRFLSYVFTFSVKLANI